MGLPSPCLSPHSCAFEVRENEKKEAERRRQIPQRDTVLVARQVDEMFVLSFKRFMGLLGSTCQLPLRKGNTSGSVWGSPA